MKARVKATGEIVEVKEGTQLIFKDGSIGLGFRTDNGEILNDYQLDFEDVTQEKSDVKEKSFPKDAPDYWEKLKHQAAIGAMQVMLASGVPSSLQYQYIEQADRHKVIATEAVKYARSLVEELIKEDSQCEK